MIMDAMNVSYVYYYNELWIMHFLNSFNTKVDALIFKMYHPYQQKNRNDVFITVNYREFNEIYSTQFF